MTPYSNKNQLFSDLAHTASQSQIYPMLFNVDKDQLTFKSTSLSMGNKEKILDGEMAIDRIVKVRVKWFKADIEFIIQERFRREKFMKYQDVTITEWNHATNIKSELFKLNAGIFVYGYYDDKNGEILDWIAFNTVGLLHRLVIKCPSVVRGLNKRSNQSFLTFRFDHLEKAGLILGRQVEDKDLLTKMIALKKELKIIKPDWKRLLKPYKVKTVKDITREQKEKFIQYLEQKMVIAKADI